MLKIFSPAHLPKYDQMNKYQILESFLPLQRIFQHPPTVYIYMLYLGVCIFVNNGHASLLTQKLKLKTHTLTRVTCYILIYIRFLFKGNYQMGKDHFSTEKEKSSNHLPLKLNNISKSYL